MLDWDNRLIWHLQTNAPLYDVAVIGSGITGAAAANQLTADGFSTLLVERGDFAGATTGRTSRAWSVCVLLERSRIANGSTRLAGGRPDPHLRAKRCRLADDQQNHRNLSRTRSRHRAGYRLAPKRQMRIARSPDRLDEYRSYMNITDVIGANAALLSPREALALWPLIDSTQGILGALYHPEDGYVAPTGVMMAMVKGARDRGARLHKQAKVVDISRQPGGEWKLSTAVHDIVCQHVVRATGTYARQTGAMLGLDIPCVSVVVQSWFTDTVPELAERKQQCLPEMPSCAMSISSECAWSRPDLARRCDRIIEVVDGRIRS
jgi:dimethylglycine dehydrogenase